MEKTEAYPGKVIRQMWDLHSLHLYSAHRGEPRGSSRKWAFFNRRYHTAAAMGQMRS